MISRHRCCIMIMMHPTIAIIIRVSHSIAREIRIAVMEVYETQYQRLLMVITRKIAGVATNNISKIL